MNLKTLGGLRQKLRIFIIWFLVEYIILKIELMTCTPMDFIEINLNAEVCMKITL